MFVEEIVDEIRDVLAGVRVRQSFPAFTDDLVNRFRHALEKRSSFTMYRV